MKSKKNYAYAHLEKVVTPSPFRVEPSCPIHKQCGGCQIQAMSYEKQLAFKESKIRNNLIRIGGFAPELIDEVMEPIVGMEEPLRYRNKAQYPVGTDSADQKRVYQRRADGMSGHQFKGKEREVCVSSRSGEADKVTDKDPGNDKYFYQYQYGKYQCHHGKGSAYHLG